jgi:anaerobic ribonucleoside-triphosphate reductase activating protein
VIRLRVAGIVPESIVDGPGIRLTLYVQGCSHRCPGCHNPETQEVAGGVWMSVAEILKLTRQARGIDGVTFSGGEPFEQSAPLLLLAGALQSFGLNLVLYSGYTFEQLLEKSRGNSSILNLLKAGWLLVDGPFLQEQRNLKLPYRGSDNQRLIDLAPSLKEGRPVLWNGGFLLRESWSKIG